MLLVEAHQVLRLEVVSPHLTGLVSLGLDDRCRLRLRTCIYTPAGTRRALSCSLGSAISRSLEPHLPVTVAHTVFTRVSGRSTVCSPVNDSMGKFTASSSGKPWPHQPTAPPSQNHIDLLGHSWAIEGRDLL